MKEKLDCFNEESKTCKVCKNGYEMTIKDLPIEVSEANINLINLYIKELELSSEILLSISKRCTKIRFTMLILDLQEKITSLRRFVESNSPRDIF